MEWPQSSTIYSHFKNSQVESISCQVSQDPLGDVKDTYLSFDNKIGYTLSKIVEITPEIIDVHKAMTSRKKSTDPRIRIDEIRKKFFVGDSTNELYDAVFLPLIWSALFAGDLQVQPLSMIMDFVSLCADNSSYCQAENLLFLASDQFVSMPDFTQRVYPEVNLFTRGRVNNKEQIKNRLDILDANREKVLVIHDYTILAFEGLAVASMLEIFTENKIIKRCANCGRIFVPFSRTDELYCEYGSPQDLNKTCGEYVKLQKQLERERSSPSAKLYKSISTMMANRINFAKTDEEADALTIAHDDFKYQGKEKKKAVGRGEITEQDYIDWLNSFKKRGTKNNQHQED